MLPPTAARTIVTPLAPPAPPPRVSSKGPLIPLPCCLEESLYHTGKLIYNLYGQKTEEAFVKNWGVGLAIEQAQSFQDLVNDAGKVTPPWRRRAAGQWQIVAVRLTD